MNSSVKITRKSENLFLFFRAFFFSFFKDGIGREEELRQVPEGSHIRFKLKIKLTRLKASKAHLICQMVAGGASFAFIPGSHQGGTGLFRKSVTGMKGKMKKKTLHIYVSSIPLY